MAIRGLAKFKHFVLNCLDEEKTVEVTRERQNRATAKGWTNQHPITVTGQSSMWRRKTSPPLRNRKSSTIDQSSGNRRGNEQVYLIEPLKTFQEVLQEAMKGFPSQPWLPGEIQQPSELQDGRGRGPGGRSEASIPPGSDKEALPCGMYSVPSQQADWPSAKTCHRLQTRILANIQRN